MTCFLKLICKYTLMLRSSKNSCSYIVLLVMRTYVVFTNAPPCVCKGLGMLLWSCTVTGLSAGSPMSDESPEPETEGRNVCPCIHTYMHVCVIHLVVCAHMHTRTHTHTHTAVVL